MKWPRIDPKITIQDDLKETRYAKAWREGLSDGLKYRKRKPDWRDDKEIYGRQRGMHRSAGEIQQAWGYGREEYNPHAEESRYDPSRNKAQSAQEYYRTKAKKAPREVSYKPYDRDSKENWLYNAALRRALWNRGPNTFKWAVSRMNFGPTKAESVSTREREFVKHHSDARLKANLRKRGLHDPYSAFKKGILASAQFAEIYPKEAPRNAISKVRRANPYKRNRNASNNANGGWWNLGALAYYYPARVLKKIQGAWR